MVPADSRWLSDGRGGVPQRIDSGFPRRGCGGQRVARTHLTSSSFRAFRFATRSPGGRRGCCVGPCCCFHQQPASGSEKRSKGYPRFPRAKGFPKGRAFPSLTAARDCQPSPAGGRRSAPAQSDPPKRLFLFHRARRIFFLMSLCGAPAAPRAVGRGGAPKPTKWARKCPWGAREQAQFSPQAETELSGLCDDDNGGRIPCGNSPLREQTPPRPPRRPASAPQKPSS